MLVLVLQVVFLYFFYLRFHKQDEVVQVKVNTALGMMSNMVSVARLISSNKDLVKMSNHGSSINSASQNTQPLTVFVDDFGSWRCLSGVRQCYFEGCYWDLGEICPYGKIVKIGDTYALCYFEGQFKIVKSKSAVPGVEADRPRRVGRFDDTI